MSAVKQKNLSRTAGDTAEHVISAGKCILYGIFPELTTTGTITVRDSATTGGSNVIHVCALGLTQVGKDLGGVLCLNGLTVQLSVGTDLSAIVWEAAP